MLYDLGRPMPFDYYASLSAKNKRIYAASDRVREIVVPDAALSKIALELRRLRTALGGASQRATAQCSRAIVHGLTEALGVTTPETRVHEVRPQGEHGELHGLYTRWEDGRARIEVWMRTAVNEQPVAFRTFLRTLAHELVHHLDYVQLTLDDSFHTEGFFARESSLLKQLLATQPQAETPARQREAAPPSTESRAEKLTRLRERLGAARKRPPLEAAQKGPRSGALDAAPIGAAPIGTDAVGAEVSQSGGRMPRASRRRATSKDKQLALAFGHGDGDAS